jgi:hypothetical protein
MNFLARVSKNIQIPDFLNIRSVEAEFFHADGWTDGQTDMTKLIADFHSYANAPTNSAHYAHSVTKLHLPSKQKVVIIIGYVIH